jgi:hypothetical protein
MDEIFESSTRSSGDMAGVFEFDGETGYFYLYETGGTRSNKILDSVRISSSTPDFTESDIAIQWDVEERRVGFLIKGVLWAVFDCDNRAKFGGDYRSNAASEVPPEVKKRFEPAR